MMRTSAQRNTSARRARGGAFGRLLAAVALLVTGACAGLDVTGAPRVSQLPPMPVEWGEDAETGGTEVAPELARVELEGAGRISFVDLGDGHVGIAELGRAGSRVVSLEMVKRRDATPLEILLALGRRDRPVPEQLYRDHALRTDGRAKPRQLSLLRPSTGSINDPGSGFNVCNGSRVWISDWKDAFVGITKHRAAAHLQNQAGSYTFYPGADVYYDTGTNSRTYLGACNGDEHNELKMEVHRRVNGSWTRILDVTIDAKQQFTFYSGMHASYRGRTRPVGAIVRLYGVGAAWTISPPWTS
ncbi:MAG: hypothetical protein ACT4P7_22365 [Gemmatimonadaceae bacterium]